jgi:hypothetical protein
VLSRNVLTKCIRRVMAKPASSLVDPDCIIAGHLRRGIGRKGDSTPVSPCLGKASPVQGMAA